MPEKRAMSGLMDTTALTPPRSDSPAQQSPAGEPMTDEGEVQASPDEQAQYDTFVDKAYELIYNGGKVNPQILKSLEGAGEPVDGLANTTAMVVIRLEDAAEQSGKKLSPDVMLHGGAEVLQDLADLAKQAGVHEYSKDEIQGATYQALDIYRAIRQKQGKLDIPAIQQDFQEIMQASQAGQLDSLLPGASEAAKAAPAEEPSRGLMPNA